MTVDPAAAAPGYIPVDTVLENTTLYPLGIYPETHDGLSFVRYPSMGFVLIANVIVIETNQICSADGVCT